MSKMTKLREAAQQALYMLDLRSTLAAAPNKSIKSIYIVMSYRHSPVAITYPWPVMAFTTRKEAQEYVTEKNKRATTNEYVFLRVKFGGGNE